MTTDLIKRNTSKIMVAAGIIGETYTKTPVTANLIGETAPKNPVTADLIDEHPVCAMTADLVGLWPYRREFIALLSRGMS